MNPELYQPLFLSLMALIGLAMSLRFITSEGYEMQERGSSFLLPLLLSLLVTFWIGLRPNSPVFGDTVIYARGYRALEVGSVAINWHEEWVWQWLSMLCKSLHLDVIGFFFVIQVGYVMSALWAVKRLLPTNPMLGMVFVFLSLMYYTFSVNGLRNGLACHMVLLAFSFLLEEKFLPGVILSLAAFGIHRSVALPIAAYVAARYLIKDVKWAVYFWLASILISLVTGNFFSDLFSSLGFDDRMSGYVAGSEEDQQYYTKYGMFRWDFLLYSAMPIVLAWFVSVKRAVLDNWYRVLITTYCLSNAFWVLVIRASYSNRFAYLSWFLYPIVIAYPLIMMPVWSDQDRKTGQILLAYGAFTLFMNFVYW